MINEFEDPQFMGWFNSRPASVQALAREFPISGQPFPFPNMMLHIIGYTENDELVLSPISPESDYEFSFNVRQSVPAALIREAFLKLNKDRSIFDQLVEHAERNQKPPGTIH